MLYAMKGKTKAQGTIPHAHVEKERIKKSRVVLSKTEQSGSFHRVLFT